MVSKGLLAHCLERDIHPADVDFAFKHQSDLYKVYFIKQGNKKRRIEEPIDPLKKVQKALISLFEKFPLHPAAKAVKGSNTSENAEPHAHALNVLKVDVEACYHVITPDHLTPILTDPLMLEALKLCFTAKGPWYHLPSVTGEPLRYERLPTGAPTSPILCNIAMTELDEKVQEIAEHFGFAYTRYLDDLTLSTRGERNGDVKGMVVDLVEKYIGPVNRRKSGWTTKGKDLVTITGISLGYDGTIAPRKFRRRLRARLQNIAMTTRELDASTKGYLAYLKAIHESAHDSLLEYYQKRLEYAPPK